MDESLNLMDGSAMHELSNFYVDLARRPGPVCPKHHCGTSRAKRIRTLSFPLITRLGRLIPQRFTSEARRDYSVMLSTGIHTRAVTGSVSEDFLADATREPGSSSECEPERQRAKSSLSQKTA